MSAHRTPTLEELAPEWHSIIAPAVRAAGVPLQDVDDAVDDFMVYTIEHDLLGRYDPGRMPPRAFLYGYAKKWARRALQASLRFGYELTLDDPEGTEPGQDDPVVESLGDLDDFQRFLVWLDQSPHRRDHATLLREWVHEVFTRDQVNRHRIAYRMGWTPNRVDREMPQLREAGRHFGV